MYRDLCAELLRKNLSFTHNFKVIAIKLGFSILKYDCQSYIRFLAFLQIFFVSIVFFPPLKFMGPSSDLSKQIQSSGFPGNIRLILRMVFLKFHLHPKTFMIRNGQGYWQMKHLFKCKIQICGRLFQGFKFLFMFIYIHSISKIIIICVHALFVQILSKSSLLMSY